MKNLKKNQRFKNICNNYNKVKRVAIVGFGSIGQRHFEILKCSFYFQTMMTSSCCLAAV